VKIPILVTGCNKLNKGFTLIELLVSIIIIGLISSIVFINFSVVDSFEKNTNSFDKEWKEFDKIMTKNNISRKECLLLPLKTTLDALNKKTL